MLDKPIATITIIDTGESFEMCRRTVVFGRSAASNKHRVDIDLSESDLSKRVSKKHAVLYMVDRSQFELINYGKNGTFVDGRLHQTSVGAVGHLSQIQIGSTAMVFKVL